MAIKSISSDLEESKDLIHKDTLPLLRYHWSSAESTGHRGSDQRDIWSDRELYLFKEALRIKKEILREINKSNDINLEKAWGNINTQLRTTNAMLDAYDRLEQLTRRIEIRLDASDATHEGILDAEQFRKNHSVKATKKDLYSSMASMMKSFQDLRYQLITASSFDEEGINAVTRVFNGVHATLDAATDKETVKIKGYNATYTTPVLNSHRLDEIKDQLPSAKDIQLLEKKYHGFSKDMKEGLSFFCIALGFIGLLTMVAGGCGMVFPHIGIPILIAGGSIIALAATLATSLHLREDIDAKPIGKKLFGMIDKMTNVIKKSDKLKAMVTNDAGDELKAGARGIVSKSHATTFTPKETAEKKSGHGHAEHTKHHQRSGSHSSNSKGP